jgi:hypothetical protein
MRQPFLRNRMLALSYGAFVFLGSDQTLANPLRLVDAAAINQTVLDVRTGMGHLTF